MRLDIDEATHSVKVILDDRDVTTSEEVRPGVIVQYDADGVVVGVAIERIRSERASVTETDSSTGDSVDPISNRIPRTPLGALLIETRRKLQEDGIPFLTVDELEREVAERRGLPPEERLA